MSSPRPLIGLSSYREEARWGVWRQSADLLPTEYAVSVEAAGGVPVLLPPTSAADPADAAQAVIARLDGLVISGGADVEPARYGAEPHPRTTSWRQDRDAWELALLTAADAVGLPVLGICRGMQLMAVHAGGSLDQHTPDLVDHDEHNPGADAYGQTLVQVAADTRVCSLLGPRLTVNCHHHQSVATHPGYTAVAFAADGTLEAMERPGPRFCLGVQWHPETAADAGLLAGLVAAAVGR